MISIIIPSKTDKFVRNFLNSLVINQQDYLTRCRLFVADDGISEPFKKLHREVNFINCDRQERPFCLARNVNLAMAAARRLDPGTHILIQNDDTKIRSPHFLAVLDEWLIPLMIEGRWAIVSPQILRNCGNRQITKKTREDALTRIREETIPFISVLITSEAWCELGPMDERFEGYGWEDVAFCFKARAAGYNLGWTSAARVDHVGSASYGAFGGALDGMSRQAREVFFRHYPHPLSETYEG